MKHLVWILVGIMAFSSLALVACDDKPTQQEANKQFCDDMGEFVASLRALHELDSGSSVDEINAARDRTRESYDRLIESSKDVAHARLDDLQKARDNLQKAVDDVKPDSSISDALSSVDDEIRRRRAGGGAGLQRRRLRERIVRRETEQRVGHGEAATR